MNRPAAKVLVVTPHYAPDIGPSAPIYTDLCEDLQAMGYSVTVATAFPHYAGFPGNGKSSRKFFVEERRRDVRILRTYVYSVPKKALWGRLIYHASFNLFSAAAALRAERPDAIIADAPALWSGIPLLTRAIGSRVPFIYVVHDIYPDVLLRLGILTNPRLIKWIGGIENFFYRRSLQVSVLSEGFKENLLRKGVPANKITVIPACVDVGFIRPLPRENDLRRKWDLAGKFVVLYAGNIGFSQGLNTVLKAAGSLRSFPEIHFVFVGEGASKEELKKSAEKDGLDNVTFFPFLPREEMPFSYALADVCLVSLKPDVIVESVPSKTYTIMASGRAIVATVDGKTEVGVLLRRAKCGLCTEPGNPDLLAGAILRLYRDRGLRNGMEERGRRFAVEYYSRKVAAQAYYGIVRRALDGGAG